MMAKYLTFLENKGYVAAGTCTDENSARNHAVFSIGLKMLHQNGSSCATTMAMTCRRTATTISWTSHARGRALTCNLREAIRELRGRQRRQHDRPDEAQSQLARCLPQDGSLRHVHYICHPLCTDLPPQSFAQGRLPAARAFYTPVWTPADATGIRAWSVCTGTLIVTVRGALTRAKCRHRAELQPSVLRRGMRAREPERRQRHSRQWGHLLLRYIRQRASRWHFQQRQASARRWR